MCLLYIFMIIIINIGSFGVRSTQTARDKRVYKNNNNL